MDGGPTTAQKSGARGAAERLAFFLSWLSVEPVFIRGGGSRTAKLVPPSLDKDTLRLLKKTHYEAKKTRYPPEKHAIFITGGTRWSAAARRRAAKRLAPLFVRASRAATALRTSQD